jgi:SAM-dependent methyltransferase
VRAEAIGAHASDANAMGADTVAAGATDAATIEFRCNLCGSANRVAESRIDREIASCGRCGSTVRFRAIGRLVTRELLGHEVALTDLAQKQRLRGLGLSDPATYAVPLGRAFEYENTFFHTSPRLDILDVPGDRLGRYDFVVASDVFEHITPPVQRGFDNARALLRPGGVFIFTVPFTLADDTLEHFPELHDWRVEERDGRFDLVNTTADGRVQTFADVVFHGGPGTTLEMRMFSRAALLRHFTAAGFVRTRIADEPCAAFGIAWPHPWSVPIVAYAP